VLVETYYLAVMQNCTNNVVVVVVMTSPSVNANMGGQMC